MKTMMSRLTVLGACAALFGLACDTATKDTGSESGGEQLSYAGFALTGDDESNDGFTDGADTQPLLDELGDDAIEGDDAERPRPDEVDAEARPDGADRVLRTVLVVWGQAKANPDLKDTPTLWQGRATTDSGHLRVARVIRFERVAREGEDGTTQTWTDKLVRDEDPASVSFESVTGPHNDGLLLVLSLPRDPAAIEGDFVFETEHFTKSIPLARLVEGGAHTFLADDLGNSLLVASHLPHRCANGMLRLHFKRNDERGGVVGGKVYDARGESAGRFVGIWGEVDGKRRMKGRFEAPDGEFRGTVIASWQPFPADAAEAGGTFRGMWRSNNGIKGVLGGVFRIGDEPGEGDGAGFWRASCGEGNACNADPRLPRPADASCACEPDPENDYDGACSCDVPPPSASCIPPEPPVGDEPGDPSLPADPSASE